MRINASFSQFDLQKNPPILSLVSDSLEVRASVSSSARSSTELLPSSTTSPLTRKRKASQTADEANKLVKTTRSIQDLSDDSAATSSGAALNTPPLTTMDSDDEFMSGLSSQDDDGFGGAQESDDGSLGDGTCSRPAVLLSKLT